MEMMMDAYRVTAWNAGNGQAFAANVADYFQAINLFRAACTMYNRVVLEQIGGDVLQSYNNR